MSFLDRIASAVMPAASDEDRASARRNAETMAQGHDWFGQVLEHHRQIEAAFDGAFSATEANDRQASIRALGVILTGHSNAEEAVLYPALVEQSGKHHATMAYEEQAMAKIQLNKLERLDPHSSDWREKLEHLQSAVAQHMYQEESEWLPDLARNAPESLQQVLTQRYMEEFDRYHAQSGQIGAIGSSTPVSGGQIG